MWFCDVFAVSDGFPFMLGSGGDLLYEVGELLHFVLVELCFEEVF